jgi:hypothetical protein
VSSSSPISPVVDHLADLALWEAELATNSVTADPLSMASTLLDRLRQVPDPRRLRGLRHPLLVILVLTACATLVVGNDSVTAIRQWAAGTPQDVLHRIGARFNPLLGRYTMPGERTFRRVLAGLDGDALDTATCGYAADIVRGDACAPVIAATEGPVEREQRRTAQRAVTHPVPAGLLPAAAVDGKLLHGTRTPTGQVFLVAAITHHHGVILGQRQVPNKRGENAVVADLLAPLHVAGMMLTLDALRRIRYNASPTQRSFGQGASNRPNACGGCPSGRVVSSSRAKCRSRVRSDGDQPVWARRIRATWAPVRCGRSRLSAAARSSTSTAVRAVTCRRGGNKASNPPVRHALIHLSRVARDTTTSVPNGPG